MKQFLCRVSILNYSAWGSQIRKKYHVVSQALNQMPSLTVNKPAGGFFRLNANISMTVCLYFLGGTLCSSPSFLESPCILQYSTGAQTLKEVLAGVG